MTDEMCRRCGGCGAIDKNDIAMKCPACNGKGYQELQLVIDAELLQKKQRDARYTIREVPIRENPCTEKGCYEYSIGDCPGEVWICLKYRSWKNVL